MSNPLVIAKRFISDPTWRFRYKCAAGIYNKMPDEEFLKLKFKYLMGKDLDLENPQTFNEKLQWLKLHDRKPVYSTMVDKAEAKKYAASIIGEEHIIPTYGVWERFDDIDFDALPNEFVLKCTHDCGGLVIVRDKPKLDKTAAKKKITRSLARNYYLSCREWPYKNVVPRIIAEPLVMNADGSKLEEYNFFCFNGFPRMFMYCHGDRDLGEKRYNDYYLTDWTRLSLRWGYDSANYNIERFEAYDKMIELSKKLSNNIPFVRIDFYLCNNKPLLGEMTFFHWGGFAKTEPAYWDETLGKWITIKQR